MANLNEYVEKIEDLGRSIEELQQQALQQKETLWDAFWGMEELPEVPGMEELFSDIRQVREALADKNRELEALNEEYLYMKEHSCVHCGTQLVEGAKFCHNCGRPVQKEPEPPVQENPDEQKFCKVCGCMLKPNARFCANCGATV